MGIHEDGAKYWKPTTQNEKTPYEGQQFDTVDTGIDFYVDYAKEAGFDVRHGTKRRNRKGEVSIKHLLCSREGYKAEPKEPQNSTKERKRRRRTSNRIGCKARMVMTKRDKGGYKVHAIELRHTHCLCSDAGKPFLKINRQLDIGHKIFLAHCAKANIGPTKAFRLFKEMVGSFTDIGATCIEFCNFRRDLLAYIAETDAQMVIEDMFKRKEDNPDFYFDFDIDEDAQLTRLFWADAQSRRNYACFGDVVSFNATYSTNRYISLFLYIEYNRYCVCTQCNKGVDNHKRCITFGAGLIAKEDVESYEWLLTKFNTAMEYAPRCTTTDQDPALKIVVPQTMPTTRHRFCMWHIMTKVGEKVGVALWHNQDFKKALNSTVWDDTLTTDEFKRKWETIMKDYNLKDHRWFTQLYEARASWIPAYFNDILMAGLLRTTSRSESENSYFGKFTNHHCSLVEFIAQYNNAIGEQRHKQARLIAENEGSYLETKTPLSIEKHATTVYTINIFYEFQEEAWEASFTCDIIDKHNIGDIWKYTIKDTNGKMYEVTETPQEREIECECKMFNRVGILCRHVLLVMKTKGYESIPEKYIVPRWTRNACAHPLYDVPWARKTNITKTNETTKVANQLWNEFYNCMGLVNGWPDKMDQMLATLQQLKKDLQKEAQQTQEGAHTESVFEKLVGSSRPSDIQIKPPQVAKNKGSGKRLKSSKEIATTKNQKKKERTCRQTCISESLKDF
ncbi:PREDICTED: protein FAR1-RELATED SEQUENCE 5-like [Ipomoea nil]|uniref:protein FAR1-RELATED SEQUENCE 5-like n=1 Tax=Ipomoea nil TaxID=35883 RepID=UPI0009018C91|nr:PREDICTED: protein FAR1-RELATED SEQUENCE 5-like [Ipomoea nil]